MRDQRTAEQVAADVREATSPEALRIDDERMRIALLWQGLDARMHEGATLRLDDVKEAIRLGAPGHGVGDRVLEVLESFTACEGENLRRAIVAAGRDMGTESASIAAVFGR